MTAIRGKQWVCSGKETGSELCEKPLTLWRFWNQGSSSLTHTFLQCFVEEGEVMLCLRAWQRVSVIERAEAEEDRGQAEISVAEKASEASREMNLPGDSISGVQRSLAH